VTALTIRMGSAGTAEPYGALIGADDLNNTIIGGTNAWSASYRFRASESSALNAMNHYIIGLAEDTSGAYAKGTGGTFRYSLQSDDGSANHFPSGSVLATQDLDMTSVDGAQVLLTWASPATLTAGTLYHIVVTNIDGTPTANYVSLDGTFQFATVSLPVQPRYADVDWHQLDRIGAGAWQENQRGDGSYITPIASLNYANGGHQGMGYIETWGRGGSDGYNTCDGTIKLREAFTVSGGDRTVTSVHIRLARTSGTGALSLRLETSGNSEIETVTIAAASIATASKGGGGHGQGEAWYSVAFASSHVLANGSSYNLVLSTTAGTEYWCVCIRKGASYGYDSASYYNDGHAQIATDGSTWANVKALTGATSAEGDLQFYFEGT